MPQSMTQNGVAAGKRDRHAVGGQTVVYDEWTLTDYDPDSDGSGNDFDPAFEYGISRVSAFNVYVADGSSYTASYDHDTGAIRLFSTDGTGEVGNNTTVNVDLRVQVHGMG